MSRTGKNEWLILFFFFFLMNVDLKEVKGFFSDVISSISYFKHPVFVPCRKLRNYPFSLLMILFEAAAYVSSTIFLHSIQKVPKKQQERKQRIADEILDHWNYSTHGACHSLQKTICLTQHPVPRRWKSQKISCSQLSSIQWYHHPLIIPPRILYYGYCKIVNLVSLSGECILFISLQF